MKSKTKPAPAKRQQTGTAFFSITGEFITDHARNLWIEGEYAKAFDVLGCLIGATREQHEAILFGKAKLTGVNNVDYVADDWTPPDGYATFSEALTRGKHWHELEQRREIEAEDKLREVVNLKTGVWSDGEKCDEARRLQDSAARLVGKERAEEILKQCYAEAQAAERDKHYPRGGAPKGRAVSGLDMVIHMAQQRMMMAGLDPACVPTAEALMHRGENIRPEECRDMSRTSGWLLPDGKYYPCGAFEHIGLATRMLENGHPDKGSEPGGYERFAEKLGWLKISGAGVVQGSKATQKQLDKLHMYAEHHGLDFKKVTKYFD